MDASQKRKHAWAIVILKMHRLISNKNENVNNSKAIQFQRHPNDKYEI